VRYPQTLRVFLGCKFRCLIQSVNAFSHRLVIPLSFIRYIQRTGAVLSFQHRSQH
jgi:hypothetical protein